MEKGSIYGYKLQEVQEKVQEALSVIIVLETDLSVECSDGIYSNVVRIIHRILLETQQAVEELVQSAKESTE